MSLRLGVRRLLAPAAARSTLAASSVASQGTGTGPGGWYTAWESPTSWQIGEFPPEATKKVHTTPNPFSRPPAPRKKFVGDRVVELVHRPLVLVMQHNNLTFAEWTDMRKQLAPHGAELRVARATVVRARLLKGQPDGAEARLSPLFRGPTAVLACDEASPVKLKAVFDVLAKQPKLLPLGARFENRVLTLADVGPVSQLPPLDILRAQLLGLLQSPAQSLVGLLQMAPARVVATLEQARQKKEEESGAKASDSGSAS